MSYRLLDAFKGLFDGQPFTYEGERSFTTDGRNHRHPIDEATDAMERLRNG